MCVRVKLVGGGIIYLRQPMPLVFMNIDKGRRKEMARE